MTRVIRMRLPHRKKTEKNHEAQFTINLMSRDEIEKRIKKDPKQNQ